MQKNLSVKITQQLDKQKMQAFWVHIPMLLRKISAVDKVFELVIQSLARRF
jgi:hypothetical protein